MTYCRLQFLFHGTFFKFILFSFHMQTEINWYSVSLRKQNTANMSVLHNEQTYLFILCIFNKTVQCLLLDSCPRPVDLSKWKCYFLAKNTMNFNCYLALHWFVSIITKKRLGYLNPNFYQNRQSPFGGLYGHYSPTIEYTNSRIKNLRVLMASQDITTQNLLTAFKSLSLLVIQ